MQLDWTHANELEISIAGMPFPHRFCHDVLPNSNWSWLTICFSESLPSLNEGSQAAGFRHRFANSAAPKLQLSLSDAHGQAIP